MCLSLLLRILLVLIFILSTIFNGALWESIGILAIILLALFNKNKISKTMGKYRLCAVLLGLSIGFYTVVQILILDLSFGAAIRLYGITKTLSTFLLIYFLFVDYKNTKKVLDSIIILILFVDWLTISKFILDGNRDFSFIGGSANYLGAINSIILIYVLKFFSKKPKAYELIWYITILAIFVMTGSRSLLIILIGILLAYLYFEKNKIMRHRCSFFAASIVTIAIVILSSVLNFGYLNRSLNVFNTVKDNSRLFLAASSLTQYNGYSLWQKIIGNGDVNIQICEQEGFQAPSHNFILEILLCYGGLGLFLYICCIILITYFMYFDKTCNNKNYILLLWLVFWGYGFVHPFVTTGHLFQFIVSIMSLTIARKEIVYD